MLRPCSASRDAQAVSGRLLPELKTWGFPTEVRNLDSIAFAANSLRLARPEVWARLPVVCVRALGGPAERRHGGGKQDAGSDLEHPRAKAHIKAEMPRPCDVFHNL